jgi:hypothetical protein
MYSVTVISLLHFLYMDDIVRNQVFTFFEVVVLNYGGKQHYRLGCTPVNMNIPNAMKIHKHDTTLTL